MHSLVTGDTGEMGRGGAVFRVTEDRRADRGAMGAQLVRASGHRQQGEPACLAAYIVDHTVMGNRTLAVLGIGTNPLTLAAGKLGERQVDAPLPQLRQPDDYSPCLLYTSPSPRD